MGDTITVKVKTAEGKTPLTLPRGATVGDLRGHLDPALRGGRLVFSGRVLGDDAATLEDAGVMQNCVIMCAGERERGAVVPTPPAEAAPPSKRHKPAPEAEVCPAVAPPREASMPAAAEGDVPTDEAEELALALRMSAEGGEAEADLDAELAAAVALSKEGGAAEGGEADEDDELAEAIRLSKLDNEKEPPAPAAQEAEPEREEVDFERFDSSAVVVEDGTIEELEKYYTEDERFVDPQFPPHPKSIYMDPKDAERWTCNICGRANPLPPIERPPATQEEAQQRQATLDALKCNAPGCAGKPTHVQLVNIVNRPTHWLRPGVRCHGCEMIFSCVPGVQDVLSFTSRQCTHYLRDDITNNTTGMMWRVIREEPRPEDVYQGALGNCWFGGALACVAAKPHLASRLLVTKDFSKIGAYIVQLHHSGSWRNILLDDTFPCSTPFEGRIEPNGNIYFSQGGLMCFAKAARQGLWVPLVEKAAAKLFGSYGSLSGGTLGEALQLLTGYACDTMPLRVDPQVAERRQKRRDQLMQLRMQLLLQGKNPDAEGVPNPDDEEAEARDEEDPDVMWLRLVSAVEAGYILGTACSAEATGFSKAHFNETLGLQTPHAYSVLRLTEIEHGGKTHRLLQFRNPWGERAPRTWKGAWGKAWEGWTRELKVKLGVTNAAGVAMYDPMSTFWIDFDDVRKYFPTIDVCRVHPEGWHRAAATGWLPSEVGPGNAFELTVARRTAMDVILWQEKHVTRESAVNALSANHDIGFFVLRRKVLTDGEADPAAGWRCVEASKRSLADQVSVEITVEGGYVYRIVALSIGLMQAARMGKRLRKATLAVYSKEKVGVAAIDQNWRELSACLAHGVCETGKERPIPGLPPGAQGMKYYTTTDRFGTLVAVENAAKDTNAVFQVDGDATGCLSTRVDNVFSTIAAVPARSRMLSLGLHIHGSGGYRVDVSVLPPGSEGFADPAYDLHQPVPYLPTTQYPPPDLQLAAALEEEEAAEQDRLVKEAIALSISPQGGGGGDDDLAAALAASLAPEAPPPELDEAEALRLAVEMSRGGGDGGGAQDEELDEDEALRLALEMSKHDPENEGT
eukprot:TRINITY_DN10364_c0_g5_i1.p1 TRINITY_DN10364_c0_g5~~TRINITY_DN10364_c0_g5_i1.p1  ORF type:complete len:1082 (+),score=353.55 TRINITY_DN10364_c0_g5_i1:38-3283(+)